LPGPKLAHVSLTRGDDVDAGGELVLLINLRRANTGFPEAVVKAQRDYVCGFLFTDIEPASFFFAAKSARRQACGSHRRRRPDADAA
jgi:hypothetical protein